MHGGIVPGFHSSAHALAFYAARDRFLAAGGPPPYSASAIHGGPCGAIALRGYKQCRHHVANTVRRERCLRRLSRP
jgi:hypothetical protein